MEDPEIPIGDKRGITLSVVLVGLAIVGSFVFAARRSAESQVNIIHNSCLASLKNLNTALVLYRADNDGYSPAFSPDNKPAAMAKLANYSPTKTIACPLSASSTNSMPFQFRQLRKDNSLVRSTYGTYPNSVIAECINHVSFKSAVMLRKLRPELVPTPNLSAPGTVNLLMRDGTVKAIPANTPHRSWLYDKGVFTSFSPGTRSTSPTAQIAELYTFETGPPEFEK